uniref:Tetraspanin n=1 Tax=Eptatretus burgeri TaxID=7764 RepID=A0A8C4N1V7_EPTBU
MYVSCCGIKCVMLMAFIFLFWLAGMAIFTLGIWVKLALKVYLEISTNEYPNTPYYLLATGSAIITWGFLGCYGAATGNARLLRFYGAFQVLVLIGGFATGLSGLFYRKDIAGGFREGLHHALIRYGEDERSSDALESIQRALKCCGRDGNGSVPESCCVRRRGCQDSAFLRNDDHDLGTHRHGCFERLSVFMDENVFYIATCALGLALMQIVGIVLACVHATHLQGDGPVQEYRDIGTNAWA